MVNGAVRKWSLLLGLCGLLLGVALGLPVQACTLWAAAGDRSADGGTLICKNRDQYPNHGQELRLSAVPGEFRYLELCSVGLRYPGEKAGVNEKGLVVVSAAASCIPMRQRARGAGPLMREILASCDRVEAVLRQDYLFTTPAYYMIADHAKIAVIEVGLAGKRSVKVMDNGVLGHTNHFLDEALREDNLRVKLTSRLRLIRINYLLKTHRQPLTLEDFIRFSQDRHDGPDNSLWRTGGSPREERTLSSWIVSVPPQGSPTLYVRLADPEAPPRTYRLHLDGAFWAKASRAALDPECFRGSGVPLAAR